MKVYTTAEAAKICGVAPSTVSKWFEQGRLKGYRVPGSEEKRIPLEYLYDFLKKHGMPLGELENEMAKKVLIISQDKTLINDLETTINLNSSFRAIIAELVADAKNQIEKIIPDCIIVDFRAEQIAAIGFCQYLRNDFRFCKVIIGVLFADDMFNNRLEHLEIAFRAVSPIDSFVVINKVSTLISQKKTCVY